MLMEKIRALLEAINQPLLLLVVLALASIIVLGLIKLINYRSFGYVELVLILIIAGLYIYFSPLKQLYNNIIIASLFLVLIYSVYTYAIIHKRTELRREKIAHHLKNAHSDFYFSTSSNDRIIDASVSLSSLTGLTLKELQKQKGMAIILNNFDITKIAGKEATQDALTNLQKDYASADKPHQYYKFEIEALVKGKLESYRGIIQPLYDGNHYLGKNVFITQNRLEILDQLRSDLALAKQGWEDAIGKAHILMSLANQAILYYDFQSKTYVATDLFFKATNTNQREYSFDEFVAMIHPHDLDYYIEQASTVNSLSTTKLKYRLLINDAFYQVVENAIYLEKERGLVSVVQILAKDEDQHVEISDFVNEEKVLDELIEANPSDAFKSIESILKTTVGSKDEKI